MAAEGSPRGGQPLETHSHNSKRNASVDHPNNHSRQLEFHQIFKSVPEDEILVESYSCALSREILVQGRMYIGEEHVCFYANIIGWVTSVVISFKDIVSVEKRNTALVFPNAIQIGTLHHRYFFTSFVFREQAYNKIIIAWKHAIGDKFRSEFYMQGNGRVNVEELFADDTPRSSVNSTRVDPLPQFSRDTFPTTSTGNGNGKEIDQCGCKVHYPNQGLYATFDMPISRLHHTLFDFQSTFWIDFFASISYEGISIGESDWQTLVSGGEQRTYSFNVPLPKLLNKLKKAKVQARENYLLKQPLRRFVIENTMEIDGIPGGMCQVLSRYCIVAKENNQSQLLVTFEAFPPRNSFFKESIKQSLNVQFEEMYKELGHALLNLSSEATPKGEQLVRSLSWWKRASSRNHQRSISTSMEIYFDWDAFWRSLLWFVPLVVVIFSLFYVQLTGRTNLEPVDAKDRLERIKTIQIQFEDFMVREKLMTKSLGQKVAEMVDHMADRVGTLDDHLQGLLATKSDDQIAPSEIVNFEKSDQSN